MKFNVIKEAIVVGIMTVIVGNVIGYIIGKMYRKMDLITVVNKDWNKYYAMEISLFITGFLIHIISELAGFNSWYCKWGSACNP